MLILLRVQADSFVPQYLKQIQREPHPLIPLQALPVFPPESYLQSFLTPSLDGSVRKYSNLHALLSLPPPPPPPSSKVFPLELETYHNHWADILRWELEGTALKKEQVILWQKPVKVSLWKDDEFVFELPGIRENDPYLEIGDLVHMREVLEAEKRGSNRAVEGRIVILRKREGLVRKFASS